VNTRKRQPLITSLLLHKLLSVMLAIGMLSVSNVASAADEPTADIESQRTANGRTQIVSLGSGQHATATIVLKDGTKLEGYVAQTSMEAFTMMDPKKSSTTEVGYSEVSQVQRKGLSKTTKILIGVGLAAGAAVAAGIAISHTEICKNALCQ
jgi:hypothetical protein